MSTEDQLIKNLELSEVSEFQSQYSYSEQVLDQFTVGDDYSLNVNGDSYKVTNTGLQSYCKLLDIPYKFGKNIPIDLLQKNVERLKTPKRVKMVVRDNSIINMVSLEERPNFRILDTSQLLEYFQGDNFEQKKTIVGDYGATIDIVHKDLGAVELEPGNFVNFGYRLFNPFTLFGESLTAQLFAEQLVCMNGMTVPRKLFGVSLNLRKDYGDEQDYFNRFKNNLDKKIGTSYSLDKIGEIFKEVRETKVRGMMANQMISGIKNISSGVCSKLFKFSNEDVERDAKKLYTSNPMIETEDTFFDIMYGLTEEAQKLGLRERIDAEAYSSTIFDLCKKQKTYELN